MTTSKDCGTEDVDADRREDSLSQRTTWRAILAKERCSWAVQAVVFGSRFFSRSRTENDRHDVDIVCQEVSGAYGHAESLLLSRIEGSPKERIVLSVV